MTLVAHGRISTPQPQLELEHLCRQLAARAQARPELGVRVERNRSDVTVDFGWARCSMIADEATLAIRVEAQDEEALIHVIELLRRHVETHAGDDAITLTWDREPALSAETETESRKAMRGFHARMHAHRRQ
jgi:hypothetical protein